MSCGSGNTAKQMAHRLEHQVEKLWERLNEMKESLDRLTKKVESPWE